VLYGNKGDSRSSLVTGTAASAGRSVGNDDTVRLYGVVGLHWRLGWLTDGA
jgi:hypothetical protein